METLRKLQDRPSLQLIMGLGGAIVALLLVAVIGAIAVGDDDGSNVTAASGEQQDDDGGSFATEDSTIPLETSTSVAGGATATTVRRPGQPPVKTVGGGGITKNDLVSEQGATRVGVTATSIRWGLHAPETFDGQPLNLAEDPLKGVGIYLKVLNDSGGVNGRKIDYKFADDRYTVEGGQNAGKKLINDDKVFFLSGTLGVDQIAQVAKLAREAQPFRVPYMAGGGSEEPFKDIGMFQIASSYDTHLIKLAQYLGKLKNETGSPYFGKTKVGVSRLDSPYIQPSVEKVFAKALQDNGLQLVKTVTVDKPTKQTTYRDAILDLKGAGVQIFVPAQDPITTGRQVAECKTQQCPWVYAISNFAHESDVALTLTQGEWSLPGRQAYGLSGGCYYTSTSGNCGALKQARDEWIKANGEGDFNKDGQGGVAGYQVVHFWLKALRDIGPDPTREKLIAAIANYEGYNDLVGGPITHKGSSNTAHGGELMVKFRATARPGPAGSNNAFTWEQISDGFVSSF
jgi:branched-chain amino acid transport system substrate-binding protein